MTPLDEIRICKFHGTESCACPESDRERFVREGALMEIGLKSLHYEGDHFEATVTPHPQVVRVLYAGLAQVLGDAPNYAETKIQTHDGKAFIVTIQRQHGKTPHELRKEAEARAEGFRMLAEHRRPTDE